MAEDRMLRASMRESETVNSWPVALRYFWTQLWGYCDSYGRGRRDARLVKAGTLPIDDEATVERVELWMRGLEQAGVIRSYEVDGKAYFECSNWDEHQSITYRKKTTIPAPVGGIPTHSANAKKGSEKFPKDFAQGEGEGEREGEIEREGESASAPPAPFCSKHPGGTEDPCRACGNARRRRDAWDEAAKSKPTISTIGGAPADPNTCPHRSIEPSGYCTRCGEKPGVAA